MTGENDKTAISPDEDSKENKPDLLTDIISVLLDDTASSKPSPQPQPTRAANIVLCGPQVVLKNGVRRALPSGIIRLGSGGNVLLPRIIQPVNRLGSSGIQPIRGGLLVQQSAQRALATRTANSNNVQQISAKVVKDLSKCKGFFESLIRLAREEYGQRDVEKLKQFVIQLLNGVLTEVNFVSKILEYFPKCKPVPLLVPFLEENVPDLRKALGMGFLAIDGLGKRPCKVSPTVAAGTRPHTTVNGPPHTTVNRPPHTTVNGPPHTTVNEPPHTTVNEPPHTTVNEPPHTTVNGPPHTTVNEPPHTTVNEPPHTTVNGPPHTTVNGPPHTTVNGLPHTTVNEPPHTTVNGLPHTTVQAPRQTTMRPSFTTIRIPMRAIRRLPNATARGLLQTVVRVRPPVAAVNPTSRTIKGEPTICVVPSTASVQPNRRIGMATSQPAETVKYILTGVKQKQLPPQNLFHFQELEKLFTNMLAQRGLRCSINNLIVLVTAACKNRLCQILMEAVLAAQHRMENYRTDKSYTPSYDVKSCLKLLTEVEKHEQHRIEKAERDVLLRAMKNRTKDGELRQRAVEFSRLLADEETQRRANEAALAAIGRRKRKIDVNEQGSHLRMQFATRVTRVNLRDIQHVCERDRHLSKSLILFDTHLPKLPRLVPVNKYTPTF